MNESKAYVATLPLEFSRDTLAKLAAWGERNCWRSAVVPQQNADTAWVAVREAMRTKEECERHVVHVLATLGVRFRPRGPDWLRLLGVNQATELIERSRRTPSPTATAKAGKRATETTHDDDTKIVDLSFGVSRRTRGMGIARRYANIGVTKE